MGARVLVVDDEPKMLRLLGFALQNDGHTVLVAQDGEGALKEIREKEPDLVILDVMLPGMSGVDICRRIRQNPETANLPIIMLSALAQVPDKISGLEAGADEYVTKPVDPKEISARVDALLKRTERLRGARPEVRGSLLCFVGAKGGVGTTTVAVNVAVALAREQKAVIAVELRPSIGTYASQLGLKPTGDLSEVLEMDPEQITEQRIAKILARHAAGVQVLSAPRSVGQFEKLDPDVARALLRGLVQMGDYVIVDLPSYAAEASQVALEQSAGVAMVMEPVPACLEAAQAMMDFIRGSAPASAIVGVVVVNRVGFTSPLTRREVERELDCPVLGAIPMAAEALFAGQQSGQPILLLQPESVAAMSMNELAELITGKRRKPQP
jgi:DNA-binding response OmpR family regulator